MTSLHIWSAPEARFIYELKPTLIGEERLPRYDANHKVVVIARDSKVARKLAAALPGDENRDGPPFWLNTVYSSCHKVGLARRPNGQSLARERVLCAEFHAG